MPDASRWRVEAALLRFARGDPEPEKEGTADAPAPAGALDVAIAALETRMLREALAAACGNLSEAARRLGIPCMGLIK